MSKTLQGHRTKLNKNKKDRSADSLYSRADNIYTVQYNHGHLIIVER